MARYETFQACLEAYQALADALPEGEELPSVDWEGWQQVAEQLGIAGSTDAPCLRARHAVKIALAADAANLHGQRPKWTAVEARLVDVLSGGAPLSQVPDTQAEEAALRVPRARIVLMERQRRGRHKYTYYEVLLRNQPDEEGVWLEQGQLKKHFPDTWAEMVRDFNERLANGTVLEPSPVEEEEAGAGGAGPSARPQPQPQRPAVSGASSLGGHASRLGGAGGAAGRLGRAAVAGLPVGPRNIPLESQPEARPELLFDRAAGAPPSLLLAGINLPPAQPPAQQQQQRRAGSSAAAWHGRGAPAATAAGNGLMGPPPQPAGWRPAAQQQGLHPPVANGAPASHARDPWRQQPHNRQPAGAGAGPLPPAVPAASGARSGGGLSALLARRARAASTAQASPASTAVRPPAAAAAPVSPAGRAAAAQHTLGAVLHRKRPAEEALGPPAAAPAVRCFGSRWARLRGAAAPAAAAPATSAVAAAPLHVQEQPPAQQPVSEQRRAVQERPAPPQQAQQAQPPAGQGQRAGASPAVKQRRLAELLEIEQDLAGVPAQGAGQQDGHQGQQPAAAGRQPAAKRRRRAAAAAPGTSAADAAAAQEALQSAAAVLVQLEAIVNPDLARAAAASPQRRQQQAAGASPERRQQQQPVAGPSSQRRQQNRQEFRPPADAPAQTAAAAAAVAGRQLAPQPSAGWSVGTEGEADVAFRQQGLPMMAAWQNKAPSPTKLDPRGPLLPPGADNAAAPAAAGQAAGTVPAGAVLAGGAAPAGGREQSPGDEEFHDAREDLEGAQQQPQGGEAAAGAAAAAAGAGEEGLPPGALHLRTQPDDVQWTNLGTNLADAEPDESLPETMVVAGQGSGLVVPETEEDPLLLAEGRKEQQAPVEGRQRRKPAGGSAGEPAGGSAGEPGAQQPRRSGRLQGRQPSLVAEAAAAEVKEEPEAEEEQAEQQEEEQQVEGRASRAAAGRPSAAAAAEVVEDEEAGDEGEGEEEEESSDDEELAERFPECTIRGAKTVPGMEGVELYVQWPDGTKSTVPSVRVHALGRDDCPGCLALGKLSLFYEAKARTRPRKG